MNLKGGKYQELFEKKLLKRILKMKSFFLTNFEKSSKTDNF